ncbi:MAG TPA: polysaccharide deacetylase family protein [Alicycliphilus sp.]|jgi:peptidoglycan/xylan/chitin deacetylase (PgdA/CDA1 family)|nr:polysaccharide deacetylase family protein [Alicycliphilus sp.]
MTVTTTVKDVLRTALYRCGLLGGLHRWRNRHILTVLMFHRVLPADDPALAQADREFTFTREGFGRTLDFVQRHYNVISLDTLQAARQGRSKLPPTPLLITFDDGWRDTLTHALPELERRSLPAVLFLASEVLALKEPRWWQDALISALQQPGALVRLSQAAGWTDRVQGDVSQALTAHLAAMPELQRWIWLQTHAPDVATHVMDRQMVTLDELQAINGSSLAMGGHGHTHGPLTRSTNPQAELQASHAVLAVLGQRVHSMSFPHGAWTHELVVQARMVGFEWVFTSEPTLADASCLSDSLPALGRIHVPENTWTCKNGCIAPERLATFLFFRTVQQ